MISSVFAEECAYALMAEVGATPKPGLVDRHDSGAHTDMDYDTFAASTTAIVPYLARMFEAGYTWESKYFNALFESIRPIGIEAEKGHVCCHRWCEYTQRHDFFHGNHCGGSRTFLQTARKV